jgi:hypothetical protein
MSLIRYAHEKIYTMLRSELEECLKGKPFKKAIEECFIIAGNHWSQLRSTVAGYAFKTEAEEIYFFKMVQPLFTAELEYYSLLYHTVLFCPLCVEKEKLFWEREAKRLDGFKEQYGEFIQYHDSGREDEDRTYYLRSSDTQELVSQLENGEGEQGSKTNYGKLIAKLWALERYHVYAQKKLKEVNKLI